MEETTASLTAFDVIVLLIVGVSFLYAVAKGFTSVLLSVIAWIGAVIATLYALPYAMDLSRRFITPETLADLIAVPVLFIVSLFILKFIAGFIGSRVRESPAGALDRALGGLLGLSLGILLVSSVYLFFSSIIDEDDHPDWIQTARLRPLVSYGAEMVAELGPQLAQKAEDNEDAQRMIERMKDNIPAIERSIDSASGPAYEQAQRRFLEREVERILQQDESREDTPENDDGGG